MLIQAQDKQILITLLCNLRKHTIVSQWKRHTKLSRTRYFCLDQLVTTETDYNRDLKLIHQKMQVPLRQNNIITQSQEKEMFPNIQGMINLSSQLLNDIHKLKDEWSSSSTLIGPTMIRYSKFLQIYSQFFKSYTTTLNKLKQLLERKEVKLIQSQVHPNSFQNLWSKPFQRPLKYKLILTSYIKHTYRTHPDYHHLQIAIDKYEEVSQRNNKALEHKEKSQTLLSLQARFAGIINNQAKYYIDEIEATMMDVRVKCHVLSNMILISSIEDNTEVQLMRILFDQNSFVFSIKDGLHFKNRLFICGKRMSTHLAFKDKESRAKCQNWIEGIINEMYKAEFTRSQLSSKNRRSSYSRDSLEDARRSYTNLPQILPKPPRFLVLNQIKRRYACLKTFKIYFIIKFMLTYGEDNSQYLYVELDELLALEATLRILYPNQLSKIPLIEQSSKFMSSPEMKINSVKSLEYKAIYATIFINFLFRHPQIVKRTDIIGHKLHISQPMWIYLRYSYIGCSCFFCRDGEVINSAQAYSNELNQRVKNRTRPNTFFCPFRTIQTQNMYAQIDLSLINTALDRLLFLRCSKGHLDYRLIDSTPNSVRRRKITVKMQRVEPQQKFVQILIDPNQRVGQIIQIYSKVYKIRMQDYQLFLSVNKNTYMLGRDEILWHILQNESAAQQNIFSFFKSAFGEKQDLTFNLYLKKVWVLEANYQKANYTIQQARLGFIIQQFMVRLRKQDIKLTIDYTSDFYACYYVYQKLDKTVNITEEELKALVSSKKWKAMEVQQRTQMLQVVRLKIQKLRGKFTQPQILRNIWNYTIKIGESCLGWSTFYFNALIVSHPQYPEGFEVKIGVDLNKFYIKQAERVTTVLEYSIQQVQGMIIFSSWQLHLFSPQFEYIFTGDCLFHIEQIMNTYLLYKQLQKD